MESQYYTFTKWRSRLWPVHGHELTKFLPLLFIKFCTSFNYTILHTIKETVIVTGSGGAEAIPVLKGVVVLLAAFIIMLLYSKLSNSVSRTKVFYISLSPFIAFFLLYAFVLYPYRESLCPNQSADWLMGVFGEKHSHWIAVYRYWMDSLYFVASEMWGTLVIGVLFWGFANQINSIGEAARFYTIYTAGGHLGVIFAGLISYLQSYLFVGADYVTYVRSLMVIVLLATFSIILLYKWVNNHIKSNETYSVKSKDFQKTKLSLTQSIKFICSSPYLGFIALMVIGYSISVNLVEVSWKAFLKLRYPNAEEYHQFMSLVNIVIGIFSFFLALFVTGNIIRKFGWYKSALLTPIVLGVTSVMFFAYYMFSPELHGIQKSEALLYLGPLGVMVLIGAIHGISCKSMKYCIFDPTKEMAYIHLDQESKVKGKAAVDMVASRFGKSGSSWMQILLIESLGNGSVLSVIPILGPLVVIFVAIWIWSVRKLGFKYQEKQNKFYTKKMEPKTI